MKNRIIPLSFKLLVIVYVEQCQCLSLLNGRLVVDCHVGQRTASSMHLIHSVAPTFFTAGKSPSQNSFKGLGTRAPARGSRDFVLNKQQTSKQQLNGWIGGSVGVNGWISGCIDG